MRRISIATLFTCIAALYGAAANAQEMPEMPKPQKEHEWLKQLEGKWDTVTEVTMEGQEPMKFEGKENARIIGGFWMVGENTGKMMEMPFTGIMTLGFDAEKKHYIGSWIDSMTGYMWQYKGKVDGNKLVLETRGPCPKKPGTLSNFKETFEIQGNDKKVFTSEFQEDDGSWTKMVTTTYTRARSSPPGAAGE
jgi:hypothetical protein